MVDPQEYYLASKDPNSERSPTSSRATRPSCARTTLSTSTICCSKRPRLLKVSGKWRERYQHRYRYLLVDEYQDTNRPQYELMKLLAGERKNVCAVGDEDQSIYSWRGADIATFSSSRRTFQTPASFASNRTTARRR